MVSIRDMKKRNGVTGKDLEKKKITKYFKNICMILEYRRTFQKLNITKEYDGGTLKKLY